MSERPMKNFDKDLEKKIINTPTFTHSARPIHLLDKTDDTSRGLQRRKK